MIKVLDYWTSECHQVQGNIPLIQQNKLWLGYGFKGGAGHFISHYEDKATAGDHREGMIRVSGVTWFTNLETPKDMKILFFIKSILLMNTLNMRIMTQ